MRAEVRNVFLFRIISARMATSSGDVGRVTLQPNFDAAGWTSSPSLSPCPLPHSPTSLALSHSLSPETQSASPCTLKYMRDYGMFTQTANNRRAPRFLSARLKGRDARLRNFCRRCVLRACVCACSLHSQELRRARPNVH